MSMVEALYFQGQSARDSRKKMPSRHLSRMTLRDAEKVACVVTSSYTTRRIYRAIAILTQNQDKYPENSRSARWETMIQNLRDEICSRNMKKEI